MSKRYQSVMATAWKIIATAGQVLEPTHTNTRRIITGLHHARTQYRSIMVGCPSRKKVTAEETTMANEHASLRAQPTSFATSQPATKS